MKAKFKVTLEEAIQTWADKICEDDDIPDGYWAHDTVYLMTEAAAAVFDANFSGQQFAKDNEVE